MNKHERQRRRELYNQQLDRAGALLEEFRLISVGVEPDETFMMLHPSTAIPDGWQVSYFSRSGPFSHDDGEDLDAVIDRALEMRDLSNVRPVSEAEFIDISTTEEFAEGSKRVTYSNLLGKVLNEFGADAARPYIIDAQDAADTDEAIQILSIGLRTLRRRRALQR